MEGEVPDHLEHLLNYAALIFAIFHGQSRSFFYFFFFFFTFPFEWSLAWGCYSRVLFLEYSQKYTSVSTVPIKPYNV